MSCDAPSLGFHRCKPEPPKLKFETALELLDVQLDRLKDEAFWCAATTSAAPNSTSDPARHLLISRPDRACSQPSRGPQPRPQPAS